MKTIEVTEKEVAAALKVAKSDEMKNVLAALFCKEEKPTPTLDDYTTIRTYEDACEALGELTVVYDEQIIPKHIIALMKLETISRALWGRDFEPKPDAEDSHIYWHPWFYLYTKKEVEDMNEEQRGCLLSAIANGRAYAGFGFLNAYSRSSYANASLGFRLCQETEEKAEYFGKQFIKLWAEYIKFNFTVGDFITK